jgi:hypothetical protein
MIYLVVENERIEGTGTLRYGDERREKRSSKAVTCRGALGGFVRFTQSSLLVCPMAVGAEPGSWLA